MPGDGHAFPSTRILVWGFESINRVELGLGFVVHPSSNSSINTCVQGGAHLPEDFSQCLLLRQR